MRNKIITVFGASGFLGTHVVRELVKREDVLVRAVCRNPDDAMHLRTAGLTGQVSLEAGNICDEQDIKRLTSDSYAVINLVGILFERGRQSFSKIHAQGAEMLAKTARAAGVSRFIHVSALGVDKASRAKYARTKLSGEKAVLAAYPEAVILRPSVMFGAGDNFLNLFARIIRILPFVPLAGGGRTLFQPIYVTDVAKAVVAALETEHTGRIIELGGGNIMSLREINQYVMKILEIKKPMLEIPFSLMRLLAAPARLLPHPPITPDNVTMLEYDNLVNENALKLSDLGIVPTPMEAVAPGYL